MMFFEPEPSFTLGWLEAGKEVVASSPSKLLLGGGYTLHVLTRQGGRVIEWALLNKKMIVGAGGLGIPHSGDFCEYGCAIDPRHRGRGLHRKIVVALRQHLKRPIESDSERSAANDASWSKIAGIEYIESLRRYRLNPKRTFYHGTVKKFAALDVVDGFGIHVGSVHAARDRVTDVVKNRRTSIDRNAVIKVSVYIDKVLTLRDCGLWYRPDLVIDTLRDGLRDLRLPDDVLNQAFGFKPKGADYRTYFSHQMNEAHSMITDTPRHQSDRRFMVRTNQWIRKGVMNLGYDAIKYTNKFEAKGSASYIILDPKRIVSQDVV